jgi:PAS domain-containing protein
MRQLLDFVIDLFKFSDFLSFWKTGNWTSFHGWLYILSDLLVWSAYFVIPVLIIIYLRKQGKGIRFNGLYILFAAFIMVSGATYFIDALMFWVPLYRLSALMRFITALISWITIVYVVKILPLAFSLKSPRELQEEIERRMKVEQELKLKNERLLDAENTARLGYGHWDIVRKEVELSEMAYDILGVPYGSILNYNSLMAQVHPADLRFVEDSLAKNLKAKTFREFYFRIVTITMEVRHVLIKGEVVRNILGDPIKVKGTVQDVSELRRHMLRIELQNKRLRKIAWVQSHRMRSPVATILGMVEVFNYDDPSDPMNGEIVSNIRDLAITLDERIREIDQLTRLKNRQLSEPSETDAG